MIDYFHLCSFFSFKNGYISLTLTSVEKFFDYLISNAKFRYIFLSYNNECLMSDGTIKNIMKKYGKYDLVKKEYQRFKADKTKNRNNKANSTIEYLHILEK